MHRFPPASPSPSQVLQSRAYLDCSAFATLPVPKLNCVLPSDYCYGDIKLRESTLPLDLITS